MIKPGVGQRKAYQVQLELTNTQKKIIQGMVPSKGLSEFFVWD